MALGKDCLPKLFQAMLEQLIVENRQLRLAVSEAILVDKQAITRGSHAKLKRLQKECEEAFSDFRRNEASQLAAELAVQKIKNES